MARRTLPDQSVPVLDANGLMTFDWYLYFQSVKLGSLTDVSATAPTSGQVLIYNSTTKLWAPGTN